MKYLFNYIGKRKERIYNNVDKIYKNLKIILEEKNKK